MARTLTDWKQNLYTRWPGVRVEAGVAANSQLAVGEKLPITAKVWLNGLSPAEVAVEIVAGVQDERGQLLTPQVTAMQRSGEENGAMLYTGELQPADSGALALGIRVCPHHAALIDPYEMGLNRWA